MQRLSNNISDMNAAISDSEQVMSLLRSMVDETLNYRGTGLSAN